MNIFIKESLYLLDYNDNVLDVLFLSTDKDTPGQAYEINIKENNTGFSDLTFKMPSYIINEEGEKVINPKLKVLRRKVEGLEDRDISTGLIPLSKVRYNRVVRYMGDDVIDYPGPDGTTVRYPKNNGENPDDYIIEDYVMDYVIQPLDKARQNLKIDLTYTAIDFPRFNLSKKKLGFTIDQNTLTTAELSLWDNNPLSIPGSVQYIPWTADLAQLYQSSNWAASTTELNSIKRPTKGEVYYVAGDGYYQYNGEGWDHKELNDFVSWEPNPQSGGYPLDDHSIKKLVSQTKFTNGILATIYYWPVTMPTYVDEEGNTKERKVARFEGVTYEKNSFITLTLYNLYEGLELKYKTNQRIGNIAWDWNYLEPNQLYLNPNSACNLLRYIVKNTNWSVANDGGVSFIRNQASEDTPWFTPGTTPPVQEGKYFIIREDEPEGSIRPYKYTIKQFNNGVPEDVTDKLLPKVNTDENDLENFGIQYDVFIEPVEVARTAEGNLGQMTTMNAQYSLNISNANCYNAITALAKLFNIYPVFDCINRTIALKARVGGDHGLMYRAGRNLKTSNIKLDGEKVITKLYVTGGTDAQGSANINIGEAVRVISGVTPKYTSDNLIDYTHTNAEIFNSMKAIQTRAGQLLEGFEILGNTNLTNKELVLDFPDSFYTYFFSGDEQKKYDIRPTKILSSQNNEAIWLRYQGSDNTHCFYIYVSNAQPSEQESCLDYLDETKQLYKADLTNIKIRRNLSIFNGNFNTVTTWWGNGITFNLVQKGITPAEDVVIRSYTTGFSTYIRYRDQINDGQKLMLPYNNVNYPNNYLYHMGIGYKGYNLVVDDTGYYTVDAPFDTTDSFVLAGPTRVYKFDAEDGLDPINTQIFTPGDYYYYVDDEENKHYYYCALQNNLQNYNTSLPYYDNNSLMEKNTISVGNYVFLSLGDGTDPVTILNDGKTYTIQDIDGQTITLSDWLINNYALRVQVETQGNNYILRAVDLGDKWDPNADEYLVGRSPYGTSYIYNFKYLYDNEWMTKEQILDIYSKSYQINELNIEFFNKYSKALEAARAAYWNAINNLELYESKGDAQLETLMSQYWKDPEKASDDKFSAFPYMPNVTYHNVPAKHMYSADIDYEGEIVKTVYFNVFDDPLSYCTYLYPKSHTFPASASNPETEGQYHVVAKALGWDNYSNGILPINSSFVKAENVTDASDTVSNYNKIVNNMKLYYWKAKTAEQDMDEALEEIELLEKIYNDWQEDLNAIEKELQENYGQYIIEGSYSNTDQPYANLLLKDGLEASKEYAIPNVTYGVNVVDASGMIEYRAPQNLIANDLVKKLHGLGQVVPKVGDYVVVFDDSMGLLGVEALITAITRRIDDPYQNTLTLDTSYTDADELVGQIITATNTVLNNKDIYGKVKIINNDGELQTNSVTDALSTGKNSISITSTNGRIVVDDNGLTATNPDDDQSMMRYNGTGILGSNNGGITWRELMTQEGINANYITVGTVNTQKVSITDGQFGMVYLDGNGLVVKEGTKDGDPNDPFNINQIGGVKNYDIGYIDSTTLEPIGFHNVSVYVGKDSKGEGIGYFSGYINANKGGNIGGWRLSSTGLWKGGVATSPIYYLGSSGLTIPETDVGNRVYNVRGPFTLKVGTQFGVLNDGNVYIAGDIHIKGSNSSNIGNWTVTPNAFYNGKNSLTHNSDGVYLGVDGIALGKTKDENNRDLIRFKVTKDGVLTAKTGTIGGWTINTNQLSSTNVTLNSSNGDSTKAIDVNDETFYVQNNGYVYAKSGKIGGWTLSSTTLTNGKVTLGNGKLLWEDDDGKKFFAAGTGTNQPVASAFSAGSDGFSIWSGLKKTGGGSHRATLKYADPNVVLDINGGNTFKITSGGSDNRRIELGTANITFRTDSGGIYLRPSGNKQLFIYGSYDNNTKYHTGASGKYEVQVSLTNKQSLCFVNGIFVGVEEN